jgi:hypothetical protein
MREAGILHDTIRVVEDLPEHWTPEDHASATLDGVPEQFRTRTMYTDENGNELEAPRASNGRKALPDGHGGWSLSMRRAGSWQQEQVAGHRYDELSTSYPEISRSADGLYHWSEDRHWLGESVFRATYQEYSRENGWKHIKRTRYFLSAFDTNEPAPLYFLAQLPASARPRSVADAREALKPLEVVHAEQAGLPVRRQGDVFAIELSDLRTRELPGPSQRMTRVLGVGHVATEARVVSGATGEATYARGFLRHRPDGDRRPDHVTLSLGDTWHRLVRNTVPLHRAWSFGGNVD